MDDGTHLNRCAQSPGTDRNGFEPTGDSFELCGGLHVISNPSQKPLLTSRPVDAVLAPRSFAGLPSRRSAI